MTILLNHHFFQCAGRYIVTEKLGRKKDQPDFIRKGDVMGLSNATTMGKDAYFRAVCNGFSVRPMLGLPPREGGAPPPRCILLHHQDPYLKLAPFKLEVVSEMPYIVIFQVSQLVYFCFAVAFNFATPPKNAFRFIHLLLSCFLTGVLS